jgi:glycosyltransferase involved in cell wall biosynthesis
MPRPSANKLVSIIMPVYNRATVVSKSIDSVLKQNHKGFELIIVDDGSTDALQQIVRPYRDKRITYIRYDDNRGVSYARNRGLGISKGDAICFLDSDDELLPNFLSEMLGTLICTESDIVSCTAKFPDGGTVPPTQLVTDYCNADDRFKYLLRGNIFPLPCLVFDAKMKNKLYFDESLRAYEDYAMLLELHSSSIDFFFLPKALVTVHRSSDGVNLRYKNIIETLIYIRRKYSSLISFDEEVDSNILKNIVGIERIAGRSLLFSRHFYILLLRGYFFKRFLKIWQNL